MVVEGHAVSFALELLEKRGETALFGRCCRQLRPQYCHHLAGLVAAEGGFLASPGERLFERVDRPMLFGGHLLALALVFGHEGAEARRFRRRYLKAQLKFRDLLPVPFGGCCFLFSLLVTGARTDGLCRMDDSERGFERCDAAAMLAFLGEQRELAFFDSSLEFDEFRFSALAIRDLRIERLGQLLEQTAEVYGVSRWRRPAGCGHVVLRQRLLEQTMRRHHCALLQTRAVTGSNTLSAVARCATTEGRAGHPKLRVRAKVLPLFGNCPPTPNHVRVGVPVFLFRRRSPGGRAQTAAGPPR